MDITKLAALLGIPVEGVTEEKIAAEITKLQQAAVSAAEEKKALQDTTTAQVAAAQAETEAAKQATVAEQAKTAEAEQRFANERKARIDLLLDNAIAGGNITPAGKNAWRERLEKDIDAGTTALFNEHAVKTAATVTPGKVETANKGTTLLEIANELREKSGGKMTFHQAFMQAQKEHPDLAK